MRADAAAALDAVADRSVCDLETIGRVTGLPRVVELWFAAEDGHVYFLAGGGDRADWVRNIRRRPPVRVQIGGRWFTGSARVVEPGPEERRARELIAAKYQAWRPGSGLSRWATTALPIAVDLQR